jgi:hypothetical protein
MKEILEMKRTHDRMVQRRILKAQQLAGGVVPTEPAKKTKAAPKPKPKNKLAPAKHR